MHQDRGAGKEVAIIILNSHLSLYAQDAADQFVLDASSRTES